MKPETKIRQRQIHFLTCFQGRTKHHQNGNVWGSFPSLTRAEVGVALYSVTTSPVSKELVSSVLSNKKEMQS